MATDPPPERDAPPAPRRGFGAHVVRLADLVLARAEAALQPFDLTPLAFDTMVCISAGEDLSQVELSRKLNKYAPKLVGLLDGLEARGLIERKINPADRRRHNLGLTPVGRTLLQRAAAAAAALEQELFGELPKADKDRLTALVDRLEADAKRTD